MNNILNNNLLLSMQWLRNIEYYLDKTIYMSITKWHFKYENKGIRHSVWKPALVYTLYTKADVNVYYMHCKHN